MIIGVAVKQGDLCICLPKPNRHHNCIHYACEVLGLTPPIAGPALNQGFYLADGSYLNRADALVYAEKHDGASTEHIFEDGEWSHNSGTGNYTGDLSIHCSDCGLKRNYTPSRVPKWLKTKLKEAIQETK